MEHFKLLINNWECEHHVDGNCTHMNNSIPEYKNSSYFFFHFLECTSQNCPLLTGKG